MYIIAFNFERFKEGFMKKYVFIFYLLFFICYLLPAQMTVSGILDTTLSMNAGAGDALNFSMGFEEYANVRFQTRLRDYGTFSGAINLIAASGDNAFGLAAMGYPIGENFVGAIELERLQFRLRGEHLDFSGGLFRLPFGFGQVWGCSDFLNPRNPLKPDARLRGILGTSLTWFPIDELKLLWFYAAPRNALSNEGKGTLVGLSLDRHWDKTSIQVLYSYETPIPAPDVPLIPVPLIPGTNIPVPPASPLGIHRLGFSFKADIEAGFVIDALYTYNHDAVMARLDSQNENDDLLFLFDGLSFSAGVDYSFFEGNLIAMIEYLYNGKTSATALGYGGSFVNNHYLYTGFTYRFTDFTNLSLALISGLDDISFTPIISVNHELFQGATLMITAQVPLDRDLFHGDGNRGELGPIRPDNLQPHTPEGNLVGRFGSYFNCSARIRLRF